MHARNVRRGSAVLVLALILPARADEAPSQPGGATAGARAGGGLRYRFEPAKAYRYDVGVEAEVGDTIHAVTAVVTYFAREAAEAAAFEPEPEEDHKPTATAFAVHADGYLLTCAHVVERARQIDVVIGGRSYPAKVLAADDATDLALLRIEATGLATLPLADSAAVDVGQDVRAFGYPLSAILGDSLKATRGSVTGIDEHDDTTLLQVDVAINPGNSGGPLVDEQGRVVGVVSAKLAGERITDVGFAVPVSEAMRMLRANDVRFTVSRAVERRDGPALVRSVSPAVGLVTVTPDPDVGEDVYTLRVGVQMSQSTRPKPGSRPAFGGPPRIGPSPFGMPGFPAEAEVWVDSIGNVTELRGGESLPFVLGPLPLVVLDRLPAEGRTTWEVKRRCTVREGGGNDERFPFGPRRLPFGPGGPLFGRQQDDGTTHDALEKTVYTIVETTGSLVTIRRVHELKTRPLEGRPSFLHLTTSGTIIFDVEAGVPKEFSSTGSVTVAQPSAPMKIPLTVSYALGQPPAADAVGSARPDMAATGRPQFEALTDADLDEILAELKRTGPSRLFALGRLQLAGVNEDRRKEIAAALAGLLSDPDWTVQQRAAGALRTWATPDTVPVLLSLASGGNDFVRDDVLAALGMLQDPRACEVLASRLLELRDRAVAAQALRSIGPACEPALLGVIARADTFSTWEICALLSELGSQASVPVLRELAQGDDVNVKAKAQAALTALESRLGSAAEDGPAAAVGAGPGPARTP